MGPRASVIESPVIREQNRHKGEKLNRTPESPCPWDTWPVSQQKCPFLIVLKSTTSEQKTHKLLTHRPRDRPRDKLGLFLGQTGLPLCEIRRKPGFVPGEKSGPVPGTKPGLSPGHSQGSSQEQPDQKVYVYVPLPCLKIRNGKRGHCRKSCMSVKMFAGNSRAGNGCANFMGAWEFMVLSAGNPPCPRNSSFGAGYFGFWGRAGSANFILWVRGFL